MMHKDSNSTNVFQKFHEEWNKFILDDIKLLIKSMTCHCAAIIVGKSMSTEY